MKLIDIAASSAGAALVALGLGLASVAPAPVADASVDGEAQEPGRLVFEKEKCGLCHGAASAGIEARTKSKTLAGHDLGAFEAEDADSIAAYLRQEEKRDGQPHRRAFKGSDEELQALLAWLASLEPAPAED